MNSLLTAFPFQLLHLPFEVLEHIASHCTPYLSFQHPSRSSLQLLRLCTRLRDPFLSALWSHCILDSDELDERVQLRARRLPCRTVELGKFGHLVRSVQFVLSPNASACSFQDIRSLALFETLCPNVKGVRMVFQQYRPTLVPQRRLETFTFITSIQIGSTEHGKDLRRDRDPKSTPVDILDLAQLIPSLRMVHVRKQRVLVDGQVYGDAGFVFEKRDGQFRASEIDIDQWDPSRKGQVFTPEDAGGSFASVKAVDISSLPALDQLRLSVHLPESLVHLRLTPFHATQGLNAGLPIDRFTKLRSLSLSCGAYSGFKDSGDLVNLLFSLPPGLVILSMDLTLFSVHRRSSFVDTLQDALLGPLLPDLEWILLRFGASAGRCWQKTESGRALAIACEVRGISCRVDGPDVSWRHLLETI
jgi:hypothetical protein